jgi:putative Mg2+ transporter-C (MgtC) family protein
MMEAFLSTGDINFYNGTFRLFLALIAGGLIGLNREKLNRAAGFRTHILICMGSSLLMLISIYIPQEFLGMKNGDPARIAAQVVAGIGFLGAGAIIKNGDNVKGLTTAASIWVSAAIGLALGVGMFWIALATLILVLFALIVLEKVGRMIFSKRQFKTLSIKLRQTSVNIDLVEDILRKFKVKYEIQEFHQDTASNVLIVEVSISVDSKFPLEDFFDDFYAIENLLEISIKSKL